MKLLLKTTKVFFALLCITGISNACENSDPEALLIYQTQISDAMNALAGSFTEANSDFNWAYIRRIENVTQTLMWSPKEMIIEALNITGAVNLSHEEKLNSLLAICKSKKALPLARQGASSSSSQPRVCNLENFMRNAAESMTHGSQTQIVAEFLSLTHDLSYEEKEEIFAELHNLRLTNAELIAELRVRIDSMDEAGYLTARQAASSSSAIPHNPANTEARVPEGFERFANLILPRRMRPANTMIYDSFMQRFMKQFNRNGIRVLNEGKRQGQEAGVSVEEIQTTFQIRSSNFNAWSQMIERKEILFDSNKEEELNIFMNCLTPLFLDHDPIEILRMIGWYR